MTTTVRVLIEGNKACEVSLTGTGIDHQYLPPPVIVRPGSFVTLMIHGDKYVLVKETGDFISQP